MVEKQHFFLETGSKCVEILRWNLCFENKRQGGGRRDYGRPAFTPGS